MRVLRGSELRRDQRAHDIGLQTQEQDRIEREHGAEDAHGQQVDGIFPHQRRGKPDERLTHEEDRVQPYQRVVGMARQREHVMVVEPELADDDEADEPVQELGEKLDQLMASSVTLAWSLSGGTLSSRTSSMTMMANTPSLKASMRASRISPCLNRSNRRKSLIS